MTPVCTFCCKLRCLLSIGLMLSGMLMLLDDARADDSVAIAEQPALQQPAAAPEAPRQVFSAVPSREGGYLVQLMSGMTIVVLCIIVLAWFARRMNRFQRSGDGSLRMLGGLSMGSRERLVLVQVGERKLLLGVTPGSINTLHVLEQGEVADDITGEQAHGEFPRRLSEQLRASVDAIKSARSQRGSHEAG